MSKFLKLFKKNKPIIIGMVHCAPLLGYKNSPGILKVEKNFFSDLKALVNGGIDAIMIENNYDIPHFEKAKLSTIPHLTDLCLKARKFTKKPLGLCVLWNDYEAALSIAKVADFDFIRVPVFVDKVKTDYGIFDAKAKKCKSFRKQIQAEDILIFADVQVKHAKHLIKRPLGEAVSEAVVKKADAVIVTGKWTGDPPTKKDVAKAKEAAGKTPVILGSGITPENIKNFDADGYIVGTYFKSANNSKEEDYYNIFSCKARIEESKVGTFMKSLK